ncbi:MAG TPA: PP2C family protein-serine/threonine phosphatase [Acidimicrobiia bacterium]|nr:PP2C family protein-serine/threonine phosphatase [Acidimicrobiia bacterium]
MNALRTAARVVAAVAALAVVVVGVAAFIAYFTADVRPLLVEQGPLSLQPTVAAELGLFFDGALIRNGQIAVHLLGITVFWVTGLLILLRGGRSPMRITTSLTLLLVGTALFSPLSVFGSGWSGMAAFIGTLRPGPVLWRSAAGLAMLFFALVFPDGRPLSRGWSWALFGFAAHVAAWSVFPGSVVDPREWADTAAVAWTVVPPLGAMAALIVRYGRVDEAWRPQIRLVVVAFSTTVVTILAFWALQPRLEEGLFDLVLATRRLEALHDLNLLLLLTASLLLLPVAVGVSVVRYRLWDMGLLVNRALVYGALTAMVAAAFLVGMVGIGSLLAGTIGNGRGVAGVVTGVSLVLVFQPLRRRVQSSVDRRFYREKYDADRAVDHFARVVTDLVDARAVADTLDRVLRDTVHATESWVVFDEGLGAASGTEPVDRKDRNLGADARPGSWPAPAVLMIPLVAQGRSVGALFLGPRRSGRPYEALDRRTLERIAGAAAPAVRVGQLVQEQERQGLEKARIDSEMAVARTIQRDLLPQRLPTIEGWRFAARYESAREVGGDYYDVIPFEDGRIGLLVADVSGKGVPAAMVMATCRAVVRSIAGTVADPAEVMRLVNARLSGDIAPGMFVTCFYGVLEPATGKLSFANAGHTLPVMKVGHGRAEELRATGMPFGWMPDAGYDTMVRTLPAGAVVVIPSDGVIEARDPSGEFWGVGRFSAAVAGADGPEVIDSILEALRSHCAPSTDLGDDVTMLALGRV